MTLDERLRHALRDEADRVEPGPDGRERIAERIGVAERRRRTRRAGLTGLGVAALLALTLGAVAVLDDEEPTSVQIGPSGTTEPTDAPTTDPAPTTEPTTGTTPPATARPAEAVFPAGTSSYDDPVALAVDFMRELVGVPDPVPGAFRQGDARSGEVPVRPRADLEALETTVIVRQVAGGDWYVLGAQSDNIVLDAPAAGSTITSPVALAGRASAFEGHVDVRLRDDDGDVLGETFVTGNGGAELGPFTGTLEFRAPATAGGALVLSTASGEDGSALEATVVRVRFGTATPTGDDCVPPAPSGGNRIVLVYFSCEEQSLVGVRTAIPDGPGPLQGALQALLAGPTAAQRDVGLFSPFSSLSAGALRGVNLSGGTAIVDFDPSLPDVLPNSSTSAGSRLLLSQLDRTVFQFGNVTGVEYRLGGDCEAFWNWLQGSCHTVTRDESS